MPALKVQSPNARASQTSHVEPGPAAQAEQYLREGRYRPLLDLLEEVDQPDERMRKACAVALGKSGRFAESLSCFDTIPDAWNMDGVAGYYAYILEKNGRLDDACAQYRHALSTREHDSLWTQSHFAYCLEKAERFDEAERAYRAVLDRSPAYTWAVKRLACFLLRRSRHRESLALHRETLSRYPDNMYAHVNFLEYCLYWRSERSFQRHVAAMVGLSIPPKMEVVIALLRYFGFYLMYGRTEVAKRNACIRQCGNIDTTIHRDFDELDEMVAADKSCSLEWEQLKACLIK
ncbi:MAG: hypothetical protein GF311_27975 [Candidatus Lokiarchaeota archaeon]|nr:hypothetical protein [Candidatus Lokiarchaeota archaeon]MBD3239296.1 hypothetical protein [Chitinivibrionales bacterium]